jgi:uncharacterized small protein (DUF1192 family)
MSRADEIHRKEQEVEEINRDMRAINPTLNLYKVLSDRRAVLEAEVKKLEAAGHR